MGVGGTNARDGQITDTSPAWQLDFGGGDVLAVLKPLAGGTLDAGDFVLGSGISSRPFLHKIISLLLTYHL